MTQTVAVPQTRGNRRGRLRAARLALAGLTAAFLAACTPTGQSASGPATGQLIDPSQPVPVALLVPTGSGSADLDFLGRSLSNAARMAAADAQGATIDLRIYSTGSDPATAAARATEAINAGAKVIIGPLQADAANAVGTVARPANVNVLSFSNNPEIAGGNVFTLGTGFNTIADRLVGYGVRTGKRRYMIVAESDIAGQIGSRAIEGAISRQGGTVMGKVQHEVSQSGIDAIIPPVAAAAQAGQIDAVFVTANQGAVLPYLSDKLRAAGITPTAAQLMGLTRFDEPAMRLSLPGLQEGLFALPDTALRAQFEQRYQAAYGERPHALAGLGYDGVSAVAALVRAGRRDAVTSPALTRSQGFTGVNGVFRIQGDGTTQRGLAVATVRNNQVVILDPAPRSFRGFGS